MERIGKITEISGPVVKAVGLHGAKMYEAVRVGEEELIGEIILVRGNEVTIQVYERTEGLRPGEKVIGTGEMLSATLGPGLIGMIYDGIQRPLPEIAKAVGDFISRGVEATPLPIDKKWKMKKLVKVGDRVEEGDIIAVTQETKTIEHRIMVPPGIRGKIVEVNEEDKLTVKDTIVKIKTPEGKVVEICAVHKWPVRRPRRFKRRLPPTTPLITGQRIIDVFFFIAKGGVAAIPGGFGTGKTVMQHQLAQWADADIIVYIGCGERGNEMTEVLERFPELKDPRTGRPLMERTILIANTSNMPVAAREASIYTGITIAEYYRDMGYDVALMADSTSRWAEALREISSRLEEMPGEEGYPAYLAAKIAEFYERAGVVETLGSKPRVGSISVVGAVSPQGGDFSEPVTQNTLRVVKVFWALDTELAYRRHFPAINWMRSYTLYTEALKKYFEEKVDRNFLEYRKKALSLLAKEAELLEIVRVVGPDALSPREKEILEIARMIREDFLMQSAFHEIDTYCPIKKSVLMLKTILHFHKHAMEAVKKGIGVDKIFSLPVTVKISRMKELPYDVYEKEIALINEEIDKEFSEMGVPTCIGE